MHSHTVNAIVLQNYRKMAKANDKI